MEPTVAFNAVNDATLSHWIVHGCLWANGTLPGAAQVLQHIQQHWKRVAGSSIARYQNRRQQMQTVPIGEKKIGQLDKAAHRHKGAISKSPISLFFLLYT